MPYTDARNFVRSLVRRYGFSAAARYLARPGIGNPRWFLLLAGDMLPRHVSSDRPCSLTDVCRIARVLEASR